MPDYAEQSMKAGWVQDGAKWRHPDKPGVIYYNAKQIWDECLPEGLKRPYSINDVGKPRPVDAPPAPTVEQQIEAQKPTPAKRSTLKGYKRDRDGVLVPKED